MTPSTPYSSGEGGLLPCPICGKPGQRNGRGRSGGVVCAQRTHRLQAYGGSQIEAEEVWNTRVVSPGLPVGEGDLGSSLRDTHREADGAVVGDEADERRPFAEVFREAYGWTLDNKGYLAGLVAGDMGYDQTDLLLSDLMIDAQVAEDHRNRFASPDARSWAVHNALMTFVEAAYAARQQAAISPAEQVVTEPQSGAVHQDLAAQQEQANDRR